MFDKEIICGVDESGRGPLAGPVFAAAVVLSTKGVIRGLADSKQLKPSIRESLFKEICDKAEDFSIESVEVEEIDRINILQASLEAMKRAILKIKAHHTLVLVDGQYCPNISIKAKSVVKGDVKVSEISAASILAKVARDRYMIELDSRFPKYGFAQNKGYPTRKHMAVLNTIGPCRAHRVSFAPVRLAKKQDFS